MIATRRTSDVRMRFGIVMTILCLASCQSPDEPEVDRTPPAVPVAALLRATVPGAEGLTTITGAAGAVEPECEVAVRPSGTPSSLGASVLADTDGSFELQLQADLLELLEVVATDPAGNSSRAALLAVGAPFQLVREGSATSSATAGDSLRSAIAVLLRDESGAPTAGATVTFSADGLGRPPVAVETDAGGRALWPESAPTQSGTFTLVADVGPGFLAEAIEWSLHIEPGAPHAMLAVAGSEQIADPGATLRDSLRARLVDRFGNGIAGRGVEWTTSHGSLSGVGIVTDDAGEARALWTLPGVPGEYGVTITAKPEGDISTRFAGVAGGPPEVHSYSPDPALSGRQLTLLGTGFSRAIEYNEVIFPSSSGPRPGNVLDASSDRLVVVVPAGVSSGSLLVRVCGRTPVDLVDLRVGVEIGTPLEVPVGGGSLRLATPNGNEEFVLALYSDATTTSSYSVGNRPAADAKASIETRPDEVQRFHAWLRENERGTRSAPHVQPATTVAKPLVERSFTVLASLSGTSYEQITATLRYQGTSTLLYVDNRVLSSELPEQAIQSLAQRFDGAGGSYPSVTNAMGQVSDINLDGRITLLLTPTVNALTEPGSDAFVGGFFFSQDLHAVANSNRMEILYGMVPDPNGRWGNVFPITPTVDVLHGVLPHELQHLVSYNEHVLRRNGEPEELWLNESLSHLAEDLAGVQEQNIRRANLFLRRPSQVTLTGGGNQLAERGMGFLFVRYLADQAGADLPGRLVQTSSTGRRNLETASGGFFADWMGDWVATLYLDHRGLSSDARYRFTSLDFANDFEAPYLDPLSLQVPEAAGTLPAAGCRLFWLGGTSNPYTDLEVDGTVRAFVIRTR